MIKGNKHTEEAKKKISESSKGKVKSEKHRRNLSIANKGKHHSPETRKKISKAKKGKKYKPHTLETKQKMSESAKRRFCPYVSEETKMKISLASKGKPKSEEFRLKLKNYKKPEEWRKKVSLALKGKTYEEKYGIEGAKEQKKKLSEAHKGKKLLEDHKQNISSSLKGQIPWNKGKKNIYSKETRKKISERRIKYLQENGASWKETKPELEAESILQKYNINYKKQFRINYLNSCKFYDFYLTDYNILLEIDGTYWHSKNIKDKDIKNRTLKGNRDNDHIKDKLAEDNGYTLIRIWEDELDQLDQYCSDEIILMNKK